MRREYRVKATATCKTSIVVYVIECNNEYYSVLEKKRMCSTYE